MANTGPDGYKDLSGSIYKLSLCLHALNPSLPFKIDQEYLTRILAALPRLRDQVCLATWQKAIACLIFDSADWRPGAPTACCRCFWISSISCLLAWGSRFWARARFHSGVPPDCIFHRPAPLPVLCFTNWKHRTGFYATIVLFLHL